MRKTTRQILFFFFAGAFLVSAPLVVLYTAGYRISLNNYRVLETGALATSTTPRGASVFVDGKKDSGKTPTVVQNILPHDTRVRFEKAGYLPWEQTVPVTAGKTTYVSAVIYADAAPEKLTSFGTSSTIARSPNGRYLLILSQDQNGVTVTLYDILIRFSKNLDHLPQAEPSYAAVYADSENLFIVTQNGVPVVGYSLNGERVTESVIARADMGSPVALMNNGKNVEVRPSRGSNQNILALLPLSNYTVAAFDDEFVILKDDRRALTVVSLSGGNAVSMDSPATTLTWLADTHLLAWSDGIEVNIYDAASGEKTFLTRQSELISHLAWHPSGSAVLIGTASHITAIDKDAYHNRVSTLLSDSPDTVLDMWADKSGKNLYLLKNVDGTPTLERRKLVQ